MINSTAHAKAERPPGRFDPAGPLPEGTSVIEAGAGTGKTYAIAALVSRYLAEGVAKIDEIAVVTFSNNTAKELSSRLRRRLKSDIAWLTGRQFDLDDTGIGLSAVAVPQTTEGAPPTAPSLPPNGVATGDEPDLSKEPDATAAHLMACGDDERRTRAGLLEEALGRLDSAAIGTIHEFCRRLLDELGVAADVDTAGEISEDLSALAEQVVADCYLRRGLKSTPAFPLETAQDLGRAALRNPSAELAPASGSRTVAERVAFAEEVRDEFRRRKEAAGLCQFDDILCRTSQAVADCPEAASRLSKRHRIVLVDECQDTDSVQWEILRRCFHHRSRLVLIGDPLQAIYGFRGGDVATYLLARGDADARWSLDLNHRSDPAVVAAVNELFGGVRFGDGVEFHQFRASHSGSRLSSDGSALPAARLRCPMAASPLLAAQARSLVDADVARQAADMLGGEVVITPEGRAPRPLRPSDIAILVRTNARGRELAQALSRAGLPVSFAGGDSVYASSAAQQWLTLLRALDSRQRADSRRAMLTDFVGADLAQLARADRLSDDAACLANWAQLLEESGPAAACAAVLNRGQFMGRVLARELGQRDLVDFQHIAQLLCARHPGRANASELVAWLEQKVATAPSEESAVRRVDADSDAIAIMTVHRAKGLQFPVVFLPQASDRYVDDRDDGRCVVIQQGDRRLLDVGGAGSPGRRERLAAWRTQDAAEELRSLYVAATRAQSQLVLWWTRTARNTAASPLHRLLFRNHSSAGSPDLAYPVDRPPGDGHPRALAWLKHVVVEDVPAGESKVAARLAPKATEELRLAPWTRVVDTTWRRTSYTGLTAAAHDSPVALDVREPDEPEPGEEGAVDGGEVAAFPPSFHSEPDSDANDAVPSPLAGMPGGAMFGTVVHAVYEKLDWHADVETLRRRLENVCQEVLGAYPLEGVEPSALADALGPSLLTPLGRLTNGLPLCGVPAMDRLTELAFEYPMSPSSPTTLADVAALLEQHLAATDPLSAYGGRLRDPALSHEALNGFLTGSIDAVLRVGERFVVIDYKTNRLPVPGELLASDYTTEAMARLMMDSHYPLQALVYCVALHRFLGLRLSGYDPAEHLGGVGYLFVRGMTGSEAAHPPTGVFAWQPPHQLVTALSDLLDGGRR
ncbi:MAG: UvrD-helicase domain-containing protein [Propionibacteriaceae bacterium]|jgi:exodeoxyribonuclease V beta subunit|nr:UvrD-helicase domain-containing protein [Propionibacteriaceae bacterium]